MNIESQSRWTSEEESWHKEVLRRQAILQEAEGEKARKKLERDVNAALSPEEKKRAQENLEERS